MVQPQLEGRGLGSMLTEVALQTARERGLTVLPICSFARSYMRRKPEHTDLLPEEQRSRLGVRG